TIWTIINDGARAYRGVIPEDRWTDPYMPREHLRPEIEDGVEFWGYEDGGRLEGVMGIQPVRDVTLIRHAYIRTADQRRGIGTLLLDHLRTMTDGPILIGTWADAAWAIRFYEKHGFRWFRQRIGTGCSGSIGPFQIGSWRPLWFWLIRGGWQA